jgi:glycerophosphoryl diester phosphodiesterase
VPPEIIAHRGTPRAHRENTLEGFLAALDEDADGIELDVHATADGVVVVHHDPVLGRNVEPAALGGRAIRELSIADLRAARMPGPRGAARYAVPTLAEVLGAVGRGATVYVEVKGPGIDDTVRDVVAAGAARCVIHAFDHRIARRTAQDGRVPAGILVDSYLLDPVHALRGAAARDYWCAWPFIDAALVEAVHGAGGRVVAWTVNDGAAARALAAMGVDALCTDVPAALRAMLAA